MVDKNKKRTKKNLPGAQTTIASFGPALQPFGLFAAVVLLVEVGVDLGVVVAGVSRVVVAGRRGRDVVVSSSLAVVVVVMCQPLLMTRLCALSYTATSNGM